MGFYQPIFIVLPVSEWWSLHVCCLRCLPTQRMTSWRCQWGWPVAASTILRWQMRSMPWHGRWWTWMRTWKGSLETSWGSQRISSTLCKNLAVQLDLRWRYRIRLYVQGACPMSWGLMEWCKWTHWSTPHRASFAIPCYTLYIYRRTWCWFTESILTSVSIRSIRKFLGVDWFVG